MVGLIDDSVAEEGRLGMLITGDGGGYGVPGAALGRLGRAGRANRGVVGKAGTRKVSVSAVAWGVVHSPTDTAVDGLHPVPSSPPDGVACSGIDSSIPRGGVGTPVGQEDGRQETG